MDKVIPRANFSILSEKNKYRTDFYLHRLFSSVFDLRNKSALAVNYCVIIHCLEVSYKEDQITSAQRE